MFTSVDKKKITIKHKKYFAFLNLYSYLLWERSGSVVECLTQDRKAAGLSLTSVTVCVLEQDTLILA